MVQQGRRASFQFFLVLRNLERMVTFITLGPRRVSMGRKNNNSRAVTRVYTHLLETGPLSSVNLHAWYCDTHKSKVRADGLRSMDQWVQTLLKSGCFVRAGWVSRNTGEVVCGPGPRPMNAGGKRNKNVVPLIDVRPIGEIIKPYVEGWVHVQRRLDNMPAFVRDAVAEASA